MRHRFHILGGLFRAILFGILGVSLLGCGRSTDVKTKVDKDVYRSIDRQWKDEFGPKANYRVSEVTPSPNDVRLDEVLPDQLGTLTIAQAVALATGRNREYQMQRDLLYTSALNLRLTRHQFEQQYFGLIDASYRGDRNDKVIGTEASVGFNRLLADGTFISANLAAAWADIVSGNLTGGHAVGFRGKNKPVPLSFYRLADTLFAGGVGVRGVQVVYSHLQTFTHHSD